MERCEFQNTQVSNGRSKACPDEKLQIKKKNTLNKGFSFFCTAELKVFLSCSKSLVVLSGFLKTTAITNRSGPPWEGGTPMAAVSRMLLSTALQMRSISTELTCANRIDSNKIGLRTTGGFSSVKINLQFKLH